MDACEHRKGWVHMQDYPYQYNTTALPHVEYQYFYTEDREPRVTVCYQRAEHALAVGIAVCSWRDRPEKARGRYIAYGRALVAWKGTKKHHPCGRSAGRVLDDVDMAYGGRDFIRSEDGGLFFLCPNPKWSFTRDRSHFFPRVVCLCGSTRFYKDYQQAYFEETMKGHIVLSVGFYPHASEEVHGHTIGITAEQKWKLDELHKRKIDMSAEILVLDVEGYIGDSTRSEIDYARMRGKRVRYLSREKIGSHK